MSECSDFLSKIGLSPLKPCQYSAIDHIYHGKLAFGVPYYSCFTQRNLEKAWASPFLANPGYIRMEKSTERGVETAKLLSCANKPWRIGRRKAVFVTLRPGQTGSIVSAGAVAIGRLKNELIGSHLFPPFKSTPTLFGSNSFP